MRGRLIGSILAVAAVALVFSPALFAQTAPRPFWSVGQSSGVRPKL